VVNVEGSMQLFFNWPVYVYGQDNSHRNEAILCDDLLYACINLYVCMYFYVYAGSNARYTNAIINK